MRNYWNRIIMFYFLEIIGEYIRIIIVLVLNRVSISWCNLFIVEKFDINGIAIIRCEVYIHRGQCIFWFFDFCVVHLLDPFLIVVIYPDSIITRTNKSYFHIIGIWIICEKSDFTGIISLQQWWELFSLFFSTIISEKIRSKKTIIISESISYHIEIIIHFDIWFRFCDSLIDMLQDEFIIVGSMCTISFPHTLGIKIWKRTCHCYTRQK